MKKTFFALLLLGLIAAPQVFAQINVNPNQGFPTSNGNGPSTVSDVFTWINGIIRWVIVLFWTLVVVMIIYTAYLYLTAGGEEEKVKKAHQQLIYTIVAIAVALLSTVIPSIVRSVLQIH